MYLAQLPVFSGGGGCQDFSLGALEIGQGVDLLECFGLVLKLAGYVFILQSVGILLWDSLCTCCLGGYFSSD